MSSTQLRRLLKWFVISSILEESLILRRIEKGGEEGGEEVVEKEKAGKVKVKKMGEGEHEGEEGVDVGGE